MRIKKNDPVVITAGVDQGKTGKVLRVYPKERMVVIQGANLVFKHVRRSQQNPQGGRVEREAPIDASKVMYYNESSGRGERIRIERRDGKRIRILVKSKTELGN